MTERHFAGPITYKEEAPDKDGYREWTVKRDDVPIGHITEDEPDRYGRKYHGFIHNLADGSSFVGAFVEFKNAITEVVDSADKGK